ncbi:hypothetical protein [Aeromonas hydrophila]|uniref:hypothetical protein n=1 Tax=Aeromonas hydrophila TaxID=644 RepID=UPI001C5B6E99|nr:hypothetical protein [Aeromonas hydrophila]MBW3844984.1 hypothetical protein [Aeromonas hydrophila]
MLMYQAWEIWGKKGLVIAGVLVLAGVVYRVGLYHPILDFMWKTDNSMLCVTSAEQGFAPNQNIKYCSKLFTERQIVRDAIDPDFYGYAPGAKVQTGKHTFRKLYQALTEQNHQFRAQIPNFDIWWNELPIATKLNRGS